MKPLDAPVLEHVLLPIRPGHTEAFRGSAEYEKRWSSLLHGFYYPFPVVEHLAAVAPTGVDR